VAAVAVEAAAVGVIAVVGAVVAAGVIAVVGAASPVVVQRVRARSAPIVRLAQAAILAAVRLAVGAGRGARHKGSRAGKVPLVSCRPANKRGMPRVRQAARIRPETSSLGSGLATPLTAKIGRIMAGNGKIAGSRLPVHGKKTGKIMEIMRATTGKNTGRIITTVAVIGEAGDTMEDTRPEECWQAWRSGL